MENKYLYNKPELPAKVTTIGYVLLFIGILLGVAGYMYDHTRAIHNYLIAYMFLVSVGVGALFLIALEYITNADWSVPIRRIVEICASVIPFLIIFVIPLLFSTHSLFHWTHVEAVQNDKLLAHKSPYLNELFFYIRVGAFFLIWILFYFLIRRNSLKQDASKDQTLTKKNIVVSGFFVPFFAISITFTAIDWMMSLEPHWFSTIFGVYYFSGTMLAALAAVTLIMVYLKENGYLHPRINDDHYYSLGSLLFVFVNFWAYIAFSQYMLIWYADLPEETFWFFHRWDHGWWVASLLLVVIHFIVPYILLLSQPAKMDPKRLKIAAIWILFAHFYDLYWLIIPNMTKGEGYSFSFIDLIFPIMVVGFMMVLISWQIKKHNLLPVGDPKLERGLNFHI